MDRKQNTGYRQGQTIRAADLNQMPNKTLGRIKNNTSTQVSQIGDNTLIRSRNTQRIVAEGLRIEKVETLPAIPTSGGRFVFWTSEGDGTGDDQIWVAYAGQTAWTPLQKFTTLSGAPT